MVLPAVLGKFLPSFWGSSPFPEKLYLCAPVRGILRAYALQAIPDSDKTRIVNLSHLKTYTDNNL